MRLGQICFDKIEEYENVSSHIEEVNDIFLLHSLCNINFDWIL